MPTTKQKYVLGQRHQFIDLNKEFVNFKLDFQVVATDPQKDFEVLVVEQKQLDSMDIKNLVMKKVKGKIGGSIQANKNEYKNYFLVVRTPMDSVDVDVIVNLDEIEAGAEDSESSLPINSDPQAQTPRILIPFYKQTWFYILIIGIILGCVLYWYLYVRSTVPKTSVAPVENTSSGTSSENGLYAKLKDMAKNTNSIS